MDPKGLGAVAKPVARSVTPTRAGPSGAWAGNTCNAIAPGSGMEGTSPPGWPGVRAFTPAPLNSSSEALSKE
eukprot:4293850-Alexandrium_andersonii.AAC.1